MEKKDIEHFDQMLAADEPNRVSRGTRALMALMGVKLPPGTRARA